MNYPKIVSREEWLVARNELLMKEKAVTRAHDQVNAEYLRFEEPAPGKRCPALKKAAALGSCFLLLIPPGPTLIHQHGDTGADCPHLYDRRLWTAFARRSSTQSRAHYCFCLWPQAASIVQDTLFAWL